MIYAETESLKSFRNSNAAPAINTKQTTQVTGSQTHTARYPFTGTIQKAKITLPISSRALHSNGES